MERPSKRLRVDNHPSEEQPNQEGDGEVHSTPASLFHPISPPRKRMQTSEKAASSSTGPTDVSGGLLFKSPFQLTRIRDLPQEDNGETVTLKDVLGDPLIAECWEFNFLHDIDFLMAAFDDDVRHLVKVHVVHGFWKREDENRRILQVGLTRVPEVQGARFPRVRLLRPNRSRPHGTRTSCSIPPLRRCLVPTIPR